jgi:hypothetical protein
MTDCRLCPAGTVALRLGVSGGGRRGGLRSRTGIQRTSDAARRSLVLKTGFSCDDYPVWELSAVVRPGHPGFGGISGDGTGPLVHRTGVPIPFPSQQTSEPADAGKWFDRISLSCRSPCSSRASSNVRLISALATRLSATSVSLAAANSDGFGFSPAWSRRGPSNPLPPVVRPNGGAR